MEQYVGLDVSQAETSVCVIDRSGHRVWQGRCLLTPPAIARVIAERAPFAVKVALETATILLNKARTTVSQSLALVSQMAGIPMMTVISNPPCSMCNR